MNSLRSLRLCGEKVRYFMRSVSGVPTFSSGKDYGMCHECGKPIREFRWALPDWLCAYCYYSKFGPDTEPQWPDPEDIFSGSYIENEESYEFLKRHLYDKPALYEPSFGLLKPYSIFLRSFDSLRHLLRFNTGLRCRRIPSLRRGASFRRKLKAELLNLGLARWDLRPAIVAVLLFVLWDDLVKEYGTGEEFSNSYWELMLDFKPNNDFTAENAENAEK